MSGSSDTRPRGLARLAHLGRRFVGSLSRRPPSAADEAWAGGYLTAAEAAWWHRMSNADRRHAVQVARRFAARRPQATTAEMAGALLHDVGKVDAGLGTVGRVLATIVGPRTARFTRYHDHERIGADLLREAGAAEATVALVRGQGPAAADLRAADDI